MHQHEIRVRFAPSPTGHPHLGNLRSMLFNWLFARHANKQAMMGTFLVRIEDTDLLRSKPEYVQSILDAMTWMEISSDEPIVYQMARIREHQKAAHTLMQQGLAYPCFCQPRNADEVIVDLDQGKGSKYPGTCRNKPYTEEDLKRPHAIRFALPEGLNAVEYEDLVLGKVSVAADQLDDFVIIRQDGSPVYNFCVVVDDIFMRITHVIRGQDHISNTPKQILFYQALGATPPAFAHIPLILGPGGVKLSKRDAGTSIHEYRTQGFLPEALFNYFVRLGWSHGNQEIFSKDEMIELFSLDAVGKTGATFDPKKLQWLNSHYIRTASIDRLHTAIKAMDADKAARACTLWTPEKLDALLDIYKERATTLKSLIDDIIALAHEVQNFDSSLLNKWHTPGMRETLNVFTQMIEAQENFSSLALQETAQKTCERLGEKLVTLAQPIRLALTGGIASPGVFELLEILGKEKALKRIKRLLKTLE